MSKQRAMIILFFIIVFGVVMRSYQLTARSLWFDEAFSWRLIQFPLGEMIARAAQDVHPPLYYILLKGWRIVFASSLISLRAFSIVMAAVTIFLAYLFTNLAARSRGTALLAAALLAFSPFQIQFAWEARMYTLATALSLLAAWLLLKAVREAKFIFWCFYGLASSALAYVHYYALFSITAQWFFVAVYLLHLTGGRPGEILHSRHFWGFLTAVLLAGLIFAPWLPVFLAQNQQVQSSYWIPSIGGWSIPDTFYRLYAPTPGIPLHDNWWFWLAVLPLAATLGSWGVLLFFSNPRRLSNLFERDAAWLIVASALLPFLISIILSIAGQSLYQDRFFVLAHLFIIIGWSLIIGRLTFRRVKIILITLAIAGFILSYLSYWNRLHIMDKPGARAATRIVYEEAQPDEAIIVSSPFVYFSVLHYATEEWYSPQLPKLYSAEAQLAHFAGGPILKQEDVLGAAVFGQFNKIWVIDTTGFGSSRLVLPPGWKTVQTAAFPEVYSYQGEVIATKYEKSISKSVISN